jgi:hypothetical protein
MEERSERNRRLMIFINGIVLIIKAIRCKSSCCKSECRATSRTPSPYPEGREVVTVVEEAML